MPFDRQAPGTAINVNFRDGWRDDAHYGFPLQFLYEPADCRILYTKEMTYDVTAIWKAVADSAWGKKSWCVAGGLDSKGKGPHWTERSVRTLDGGLGEEDRELTKRMREWKRALRVEDYPMDLFTDLSGLKVVKNGFMYP